MSLRVYNTLTRQKEIFESYHPGKVSMYLCGPTVYKPPHIGHMVGPIIFDAIKRFLLYKGYAVTWVVNITDVDDKLIEAAAKRNTSVPDLAAQYTAEYLHALATLGVDTIDHFPKASEHMADILALCQRLADRGCAYAVDGNLWFDVAKDADYGKLSHRRVEEQESGNRTLEGAGKKNPADFALWKAAKPGEPQWDSPWGPGRPGWHIECSAMSIKLLGKTFDIHGGGMDLMFPHHENELAQSESATGQPFARYWLHNGLTRLRTKAASGEWRDEKMSGSLGNVVDVQSLVQAHGPELIRYLLLSTHYRSPIDFSDDVVASSKKGMNTFARLFERIERLAPPAAKAAGPDGKPADPQPTPDMEAAANNLLESPHGAFVKAVLNYKIRFLEVMDDDFNTAGAIAVLHEIAGETNGFIERNDLEKSREPVALSAAAAAAQSIRNLGQVLGLFRQHAQPKAAGDDGLAGKLMSLIIQLRKDARAQKNFPLADAIRNGLTEIGVTLEDRADGTEWRKA